MVVQFHSWEAALQFTLERRNEGYFAEICDMNVPFLWGASVVGGIRVITSEEAAEDGISDEVPPLPSGRLSRLFSCAASLFFCCCAAILCLFLVLLFIGDPLGFALVVIVWSFLVVAGLILFTIVSLASEYAMKKIYRTLLLLLALPLVIAMAVASI